MQKFMYVTQACAMMIPSALLLAMSYSRQKKPEPCLCNFLLRSKAQLCTCSIHAIPSVPAQLLCEEANARLAPEVTVGHQGPAEDMGRFESILQQHEALENAQG